MKALLLVICLPLAAAACGGAPSPFVPSAVNSGSGSLAGTVVTYGDRSPLSGVTVLLGASVSTTDSLGRFSLVNLPASGAAIVTVGATGHLFRGVGVSLSQARSNLTVDVIKDAPPFMLDFYRAFARNGYEQLQLQPLKPWTRAPSFYVKMIVEGTTTRVSEQVVDRIKDLFAKSVPELSGGKFQVAAFETGDVTRPLEDGWVNVTFHQQLGAAFGQSTVGGNSGTMSIRYGIVSSITSNPFNCLTPEVSIADHEITHTMGYWHTPDIFVDSFSGTGCPGAPRPAHVQYHAALVYSRPPGNRDPDVDPAPSAQSLAPGSASRPMVSCFEGQVHR